MTVVKVLEARLGRRGEIVGTRPAPEAWNPILDRIEGGEGEFVAQREVSGWAPYTHQVSFRVRGQLVDALVQLIPSERSEVA